MPDLSLPGNVGDRLRRVYMDGMSDVASVVQQQVAADLAGDGWNRRHRQNLQRKVARRVARMERDAMAALDREVAIGVRAGTREVAGALGRAGFTPADVDYRHDYLHARRLLRDATRGLDRVAGRAYKAALNGDADVAMRDFADYGLRGRDSAGRRVDLPSYAEMVAMNESRGAREQSALARWEASGGPPYVFVPIVLGACLKCARWEGMTLSVGGEPPTLADAEDAGLHHPHCRHVVSPTVPGRGSMLWDAPLTAVAGGSLERAQLRAVERAARQQGRRALTAVSTDARRAANRAVRVWRRKARTLAQRTGLGRDLLRERP